MIIIKRFILIIVLGIYLCGCTLLFQDYYPMENEKIGWLNNQFSIDYNGIFNYRCYDDNDEIKYYSLANSVYAHKVIDNKFYVISCNRYCVVDKNNICKVYIHSSDYNKEINSQKDKILDTEHCYTADSKEIIYADNVVRLNSYSDFSPEERENIEKLNNEALAKNQLFKNDYCEIISTYTGCDLNYFNEDGTKSWIIFDVCDFKIHDNKLFVSGLGEINDFEDNDYAVIEGDKVKVFNLFTRSVPDYYINNNITNLNRFSEFSTEEQEILKTLKCKVVLRTEF